MNREKKPNQYKKMWRSWATRKTIVTAWKIIKEKMATTDNLVKRGMTLNDEEKTCHLCMEKEENTRHIFFECKVSFIIWSSILNWLGIPMALHTCPTIHFLQFGECLERGAKAKAASTIWIGTVWSLWNLRNEVVFNKVTINVEREINKIKINVWHWISTQELRLANFNTPSVPYKLAPKFGCKF
ncbi:hypothetical protein ACS0TY_001524 [Phlomoides rotata]